MCIRDRYQRRVRGQLGCAWQAPRDNPMVQCASKADSAETVAEGLVIMGTVMVVAASFVSVCGINVQKMAHNRNQKLPTEERKSMHKDWRWWGGLLLMVGGSFLDLLALPFVPQSRVSALGASGIVANVIITPLFLKERPTRYDWIGCFVVTVGCTLATIFGASSEPDLTAECLLDLISANAFVIYICLITGLLGTLMYLMEGFRRKKHAVVAAGMIENDVFETRWACEHVDKVNSVIDYPGRRSFVYFSQMGPQFYPVIHAGFAGIAGAQSIMLAKAVLILLGHAVSGPQRGYAALLLLGFLVPFVLCLWLQITYMNIALKIYPDALFILPVYQSFWIVFGIASGLIFYQEYKDLTALGYVMFILGVLISLVGVAVLAQRKSRPRASSMGLEKPWCDEDGNDIAVLVDEPSFPKASVPSYEHPLLAVSETLSGLFPLYDAPIEIEDDFRSYNTCLLYTSDAADEEDSVDLGGRRIIKKKKNIKRSMSRL
eukprot:TRINITY_DN11757_c0_g5_i2.p1 TRINITY_DN11757_c0_g5~~TRINITY_DN11757_c0_g5_i2.p1  ORF type:complete len:490 (+),score=112.77 TRINITY_DN11757_c0_g5_i2:143-1612(+)